jgi:hypothetical protein
MHRSTLLTGLLAGFSALSVGAMVVILVPAAAGAATPKQRAATCRFYADQQKLAGPKRAEFMAKCTSNKNEPRGPAAGAAAGPPGSEPEPEDGQQQ